MQIIMSSLARPELRTYVRAYAQRICRARDPTLVVSVPAQLEQILNFELGEIPTLHHRESPMSDAAWMGGGQVLFPGVMELQAGVETFAIFFQPTACSLLFKIPTCEITNRLVDASAVAGASVRALWNRLGEASTFESRVNVAEEFLLDRVARVTAHSEMAATANYIFRRHGAIRINALAAARSIGIRQFERRFEKEMGVSPKSFARVARFQGALDAKLASPQRTWLDIAHAFGYHDQMHMVHDFEGLGGTAPTQLIAQMGDGRPPALAAGQ